MKRFAFLFILLALLAACSGPAQTPVPTVDVNATIAALSGTMMAGTLTAQPTQTPTATTTFTPEPTATFTLTPEPTATFTPEPTATFIPFYGEFTPAGLPAGVDRGYVLFQNDSSIKTVHLNIQGTTAQGERPYYYKWTFEERQHRHNLPFGTYQYVIFLGEKKMFSGSFRIYNYDKTTFFIRDDKIVIAGP
ncbi:MAG: hypothetical protein DDG60_09435 [Anaerolineae bacterium]|nr:MAG: hypothetical protein DDG60_09435 [Anaerolineae bacterium]